MDKAREAFAEEIGVSKYDWTVVKSDYLLRISRGKCLDVHLLPHMMEAKVINISFRFGNTEVLSQMITPTR